MKVLPKFNTRLPQAVGKGTDESPLVYGIQVGQELDITDAQYRKYSHCFDKAPKAKKKKED